MKIKKNEMFLFSAGSYSNYEVITICKAKTDIDIELLKKEYLKNNPDEEEDYCFKQYKFVKWIIVDKKLAEEIRYKEWHLGSYAIADFSLCKSESIQIPDVNSMYFADEIFRNT